MPSLEKEISNAEPRTQIRQLILRVSETAMDLQFTENFFSAVERRFLQLSPLKFDIDKLKTSLQKLKSSETELSSLEVLEIEFQLYQELYFWQSILEERNKELETYHFRRFCDAAKQPLDFQIFLALARFYRNLPYSAANQSKFDLVMTRLFSKDTKEKGRQMRMGRETLTKQLIGLFRKWDGNSNRTAHSSLDALLIAGKFDEFIVEAELLMNIEDLIRSDLFERLRAFKREMGRQFFEPTAIAASVECNIVVGNVFNDLLAEANESLSSGLAAEFDFAGAFHDTSPNAQTHISVLLDELRPKESAETGPAGNEELAYIRELLERVCPKNDSSFPETEEIASAEDPVSFQELPLSAKDRLAPLFSTIAQSAPDTKLLRQYMQKSRTLEVIDLNDFLASSEDSFDGLCRDVLAAILWAEEICENELNQPKDITQILGDEIKTLVQNAQDLAEKLEYVIEISEPETQSRLLVVSNKLLEMRLKLERSVVRFSSRNQEYTQVPKIEEPTSTLHPPTAQPVQRSDKPRINRWLFVITIFAVLFCGMIYFFNQKMNPLNSFPQDVERLEAASLPSGEHLMVAYRKKNTLFVTALNSWKELPEEKQRKSLRDLLDFPGKNKIEAVVVIDGEGQPLGEISPRGVNLIGKVQIADIDLKN